MELHTEMANVTIEMVKKNYSSKARYWNKRNNEARRATPEEVFGWFTDYLVVMVYIPDEGRRTQSMAKIVVEAPQLLWDMYYRMTNEDPEMEEAMQEASNGAGD